MFIETRPETAFLHVDASGEFSLEEAKRTFLEMLAAVAMHKARKVLIDGRKVVGEPKTMERFYYGEFAAQAVARSADRERPYVPQFAYVLHEPVLDPQRFGERVARNRGMYVKVFDHLEEALEWLGTSPADETDSGDA